ncbi:GldG family protein [Candidatus Poribacteria bacterium]|nr:GldG family protein [Candidatus Poribacteria bacterium]
MNGDKKPLYKIGTLCGLLGILGLMFALAVRLVMGRFGVLFFISTGVTLACWTVYVVTHLKGVLSALKSRQAVYGSNVFITVVLALAAAVIVNVIIAQGFDKDLDLTSEKLFTLTDQTKEVLKQVKEPIKVLAFFSEDETNPRFVKMRKDAKDLLDRYEKGCKLLEVQWIDPFVDREMADKYKVDYNGTVVFEMGKRRETVTETDEQKFTNAIYKLIKGEVKKIYFLRGHDEKAPDDYDERKGYSDAREALENQNFEVKDLYLAAVGEVPSDCAALVIAGPQKPLSDVEVRAIERYLNRGGKLLVMIDPPSDRFPKLVKLLDKWGVKVGNDLVVDRNILASYLDPRVPLVRDFEYHVITKHLSPVPFSFSCSVTPEDKLPERVTVTSLAKTTPAEGVSWGETSRKKFKYDPDKDTKPPVSLAVAVEKTAPPRKAGEGETSSQKQKKPLTRMVVVGDSDFASNQFFKNTGGGDLFLNSISWLTMEEDLIKIRAQKPENRDLRPISPGEARLVQLMSIFVIPFLVFAAGVIVWWTRR